MRLLLCIFLVVVVDCFQYGQVAYPEADITIEHQLLTGTVKNVRDECKMDVYYNGQTVKTHEINNTVIFTFSLVASLDLLAKSKFLTLMYFECLLNRSVVVVHQRISLLQRQCLMTPFTKLECVPIVNHVCPRLIKSSKPSLCKQSSDLLQRICNFDCKESVPYKNYTCDNAEVRSELQPPRLFQRYSGLNQSADGRPCLLWTDTRLETLASDFILPYVAHNLCYKLPGSASYHCAVEVGSNVSVQLCVKEDKTSSRLKEPITNEFSLKTKYMAVTVSVCIVGALSGVTFCVSYWFAIQCRRANANEDIVYNLNVTNIMQQPVPDDRAYVDLSGAVVFSKLVKKSLLSDWLEVERNDLVHVNVCGGGQQSRISVALMKTSGRKVIVKSSQDLDDDELEREALILNDLKHPNIVKILGVCSLDSPLWLVLEYLPMGDLKKALVERKDEFDLNTLLMFCQHVWYGMRHMSGRLIVHRDLAARNCLLTETGAVKISDFGMSDLLDNKDDYTEMEADAEIPIRWMPPEALCECRYYLQSDSWQFGVLMWEIFSLGMTPYQEITCEEVVSHVGNGKVLGKTSTMEYPDSIYLFMRRCFNYDYLERPNFVNNIDTESLICLADDLKLWLSDPYHRNKSFYKNAGLLQIT